MAGGYRGGNGKSSPRVGSGGRSSPKASSSGKPKDQVSSGKVVQYSIKNKKGSPTYVGATNYPTRRAGEYRESGKMAPGDKLVVETRTVSRAAAEKVEAAKLSSHRCSHGSNPKHNVTRDGKYH